MEFHLSDKLEHVMTKPIIALDLDGTLLSMGDLMHPKDKRILLECKEVTFIFASGRQRFGIRKSMQANDLFQETSIPFPMVLINGGALYLPDEVLWNSRPFSTRVQEDLIRTLNPFNDIPFVWQSLDRMYLMHPTSFAVELMKAIGVEPFRIDDRSSEDPFYKVICWSDDEEHLSNAQKILQKYPLEIYASSALSVEFNPRGVTKGEGLMQLIQHLGKDQADIYAAGDSENDLPLFPHAKISFTPSSAPVEIQQQADVVIDAGPQGILEPLLKRI